MRAGKSAAGGLAWVWLACCVTAAQAVADDVPMETTLPYGLIGDGTHDDTSALQAALADHDVIELPPGRFKVTRTLRLRSGSRLRGQGALTVLAGAFNGPVLASERYLDAKAAPLRGFTVIEDLHVLGADRAEYAENHGIVLLDYFSRIRDVEVRDVGGHGVVLAAQSRDAGQDQAGDKITTLVENRLENVVVRGSHRTSFQLGERGNRRLTDGYLYGCVSQSKHAIEAHLFLGSAGGWRIRDFHGYGRARTGSGMVIAGGFRTKLSGVHLQNFERAGIDFVSTQESVFIDGLSFDSDGNAEAAVALRIGRAAGYAPEVFVSGLSITKDRGDAALVPVWAAAEVTVSLATDIATQGAARSRIGPAAGPGRLVGRGGAIER